MMYKNPMSKLRMTGASLLLIPVFISTIFITSCKEELHKKTQDHDNKLIAGQAELMPEFPGGNEALMNYLIKQITYPENSKQDGVEGKVFVKFVISAQGKVQDVEVEKGVNEELDAEAVRVISLMPDWKPGIINGNNTSTQLTLPIMFSLK